MTQPRPYGLLFLVALLSASLGALLGASLTSPPPPPTQDPRLLARLDELEGTIGELRARLEALEERADEPAAPAGAAPAPSPTAATATTAAAPATAPAATPELVLQLDLVRAAQEREHRWRSFFLTHHVTDQQSNALMHACAEAQGKRSALFEKKPDRRDWDDDDTRQLDALTARVLEDARSILTADQLEGFAPFMCW
jgi:hypothetical protein